MVSASFLILQDINHGPIFASTQDDVCPSGPFTLASSDGGVSASQGLPTSKALHIDCPVSSRMRSKIKQHQSDQDHGNDSTTVLPSNPKSSVYTAIYYLVSN